MERSKKLAQSSRSYLIAPAGCGKTYLIAEAVAKHSAGRELVLTHTHAGVDALRRKLRELGASPKSFHLDTIAGWALHYTASFPVTSGLTITKPKDMEWLDVYEAAANLLEHSSIKKIVRASYTGVYVDEYQDCTIQQHKLILKLAAILPCRILGDPLQGIFGFGHNVLVDWDRDIAGNFERLDDLSTLWRWEKGGSPELGEWLKEARSKILKGQPIDLRSAPKAHVHWIELSSAKNAQFPEQLKACRAVPRNAGNILAIHQWEPQCNRLVNSLAPLYWNVETIECEDLIKSAEVIHSKNGIGRVDALVDFACKCITGVRRELGTILGVLHEGRVLRRKPYKHQAQLNLLGSVLKLDSLAPVLPALQGIGAIPGVTIWRRELYYAMCQSLREFATGSYESLQDAAWAVRNRTRHIGRRIGRRSIGRTLLIKGLEFDRCLLLDADSLRERDLYVALTRATKSLTILSRKPVLRTPDKP